MMVNTSFIQSGKTDEGFREEQPGLISPTTSQLARYSNACIENSFDNYDFYNYSSSSDEIDANAVNSNDEEYDEENVCSGSMSPDVFSSMSYFQKTSTYNNNSIQDLAIKSFNINTRRQTIDSTVKDIKSHSLNETDFISRLKVPSSNMFGLQQQETKSINIAMGLSKQQEDQLKLLMCTSGGTNRKKSKRRRRVKSSKRLNDLDSFSSLSTSVHLSTIMNTSANTQSVSVSSLSTLSTTATDLQNDIEQISYSITQMEEAFESIAQVAPLFEQMRETKRELFLSAYGVYLFLYDRLLDPSLDIDHGDSRVVQLERLSQVKITKLMMKLVLKNFINLINKDDNSYQYDIDLLKNFKLPKLSKGDEDESSFAKIINFELLNNTDVNSMREKILYTILETGFVSCLRLGADIVGIDYFIFAFYFVEHMFYSKDGLNHLDAFSEELLDCVRIFDNVTSTNNGESPMGSIKDTQETSSDMHAKDMFGNSDENIIMTFTDWECGINLSLNSCMTLIQSLLLYSLDSDRSHESFLVSLHALDMDKNNIYALLFIHFYTSNDGLIEEDDILKSNNCGNFMNNSVIAKTMETIFKENGQLLCEHSHFFKLLEKLSIIKQ